MQTCELHDDCVIVYNKRCPMCDAEKEIDRYLGDIEELQQDKVSLRDENKDYEHIIESLKSELHAIKHIIEPLKSELDAIKNDPTQGGD